MQNDSVPSKSLIESKTFWTNLLGPVFLWLATKYGIDLDADTQGMVILAVMSLANIALRHFTSQPIGSVLPQA